MFSRNNVRSILKPLILPFAVVGILTIILIPSSYSAGTKSPKVENITIPQTAEEHLAMAEKYKEKAAQYREDASFHRKMKEDYKRTVATNPKSPVENPWITKMNKHCEQYIKDADNLGDETVKFSEYHLMRAKELQGQ